MFEPQIFTFFKYQYLKDIVVTWFLKNRLCYTGSLLSQVNCRKRSTANLNFNFKNKFKRSSNQKSLIIY